MCALLTLVDIDVVYVRCNVIDGGLAKELQASVRRAQPYVKYFAPKALASNCLGRFTSPVTSYSFTPITVLPHSLVVGHQPGPRRPETWYSG
jgi:hypothetical protein